MLVLEFIMDVGCIWVLPQNRWKYGDYIAFKTLYTWVYHFAMQRRHRVIFLSDIQSLRSAASQKRPVKQKVKRKQKQKYIYLACCNWRLTFVCKGIFIFAMVKSYCNNTKLKANSLNAITAFVCIQCQFFGDYIGIGTTFW